MPENYITCQDEKGSINISEDVVAAMVRAAITEVDGVAGVATSTGTELAELLGIKSAAKGIKVQIVDGTMTVDTIITVRYGCSVVAVAKAVQESVTSAVESMTGMGKPIVNVPARRRTPSSAGSILRRWRRRIRCFRSIRTRSSSTISAV